MLLGEVKIATLTSVNENGYPRTCAITKAGDNGFREVLEIPIINEDHGNYDGVQFGFSDKEPDFWIWSENK